MSNIILDEPVPNINVTVLKPTEYTALLPIKLSSNNQGLLDWLKSFVPSLFSEPEQEDGQGWVDRLVSLVPDLFNKPQPNFRLVLEKTSLNRVTNKYVIKETDGYDPVVFLNTVKGLILSKLRESPQSKVRASIICTMVKSDPATGVETRDNAHFSSRQETIYEGTDLEEVYQDMKDKILESFAVYQKNGSGWRFEAINTLELNISKSNPIKGSSYIPLPKKLKGKKALINMKNNDQQCFKWCIARACNPVESHSERVTKKLQEQAEKLNWKGVNFPTSFSDIDRFEKNNMMSVVVLSYDTEDEVSILRTSKETNEKTVTLIN